MKKLLKRNSRDLYHFVNGEKKYNKNDNMTGNCTGLYGDCTGLRGDCSGLCGNCSGLHGDCSGISGDCSGLSGNCSGLEGNLDKCREGDLSSINIEELIEDSK